MMKWPLIVLAIVAVAALSGCSGGNPPISAKEAALEPLNKTDDTIVNGGKAAGKKPSGNAPVGRDSSSAIGGGPAPSAGTSK